MNEDNKIQVSGKEYTLREPITDETQGEHPWTYMIPQGELPGIAADGKVSHVLRKMGQMIMRRPGRGLSAGERELIAAFTSKLNNCDIYFRIHAEAAKFLYGAEATTFLYGEEDAKIPARLRALLVLAVCVQGLDRKELPLAIQDAKFYSCTDQEIWDTILIASFFSMMNRLGSVEQSYQPYQLEAIGESIAKYGYTMSVRKFFAETLPVWWSNFWSSK